MKYLILGTLLITAGCSVTALDLRQQAESCNGKVIYQARVSAGEESAKYTCEWDGMEEF